MEVSDAKKRVLAAQTLLSESAGSFAKFSAVKNLVQGIHPHLDKVLSDIEKEFAVLEQILGADYVTLGIENLPEGTENQKRRKDAILVFWRTWNNLRGEVQRVSAELEHMDDSHDLHEKTSHWANIVSVIKGPFGLLTLAAIILVSMSAYTSVDIMIRNQGCPTMVPSGKFPNFIPGISLPNEPIASGSSVKAAIPAIPLSIEDKANGTLVISSLFLHMNFQLGSIKSVDLDGMELLGHHTDVNLGKQKMHILTFICK